MAATLMRLKGVNYSPNLYLFATSLWTKEYHVPNQRELHTSLSCQVNRKKDNHIAVNLRMVDHEDNMEHRNLPIFQLPDYSYSDGRPTGLSICQKQRQEKNFLMARQIVKLVGEMKFAQEEYVSKTKHQSNKNQARIDSMLKGKNTRI